MGACSRKLRSIGPVTKMFQPIGSQRQRLRRPEKLAFKMKNDA
jgi:hypothetical protein